MPAQLYPRLLYAFMLWWLRHSKSSEFYSFLLLVSNPCLPTGTSDQPTSLSYICSFLAGHELLWLQLAFFCLVISICGIRPTSLPENIATTPAGYERNGTDTLNAGSHQTPRDRFNEPW